MAEKKLADWEKIWHSGLDYVAPGHEVGTHPAEQGNVTWTRSPSDWVNDEMEKQRAQEREYANYRRQFDIVHTSDYKQEPLPGEWLIFR